MKVAVMQPYFFPYIGYFQLIAQSDVFVLHDDVQYIKGGWVNRNRILHNGESRMITLPVKKDAHHLAINARNYIEDNRARKDILNVLKQAYAKAPFFAEAFPLIEDLLMFKDNNVARFNENLIRRISAHLKLACEIVNSSEMIKDDSLAGEARVLEICKRLGATDYTNPIGGTELYHHDTFARCDIALHFLEADNASYTQFDNSWAPFLSIIDVLMFNQIATLGNLLAQHKIHTPGQLAAHH
ncbi:MAG: WbqC family protein [Gallionella sp.]